MRIAPVVGALPSNVVLTEPAAAGLRAYLVAKTTDRLSFAHLLEVLRLSGFAAIADGRDARTESDLLTAAETVRQASEEATRGFPQKLDLPFGLHVRKD